MGRGGGGRCGRSGIGAPAGPWRSSIRESPRGYFSGALFPKWVASPVVLVFQFSVPGLHGKKYILVDHVRSDPLLRKYISDVMALGLAGFFFLPFQIKIPLRSSPTRCVTLSFVQTPIPGNSDRYNYGGLERPKGHHSKN